MNKLNPVYLLLLFLIASLFALYNAVQERERLEDAIGEYRYKKEIALKLKALKNAYNKRRKQEILRLKGLSKIKKSGVVFQEDRDRLHIKGAGIDPKTADLIVAKVFNSTFNLSKISLRKQKEGIDIDMEIVWR